MADGGGGFNRPSNGGEFLLSLLQKQQHPQRQPQPQPPTQQPQYLPPLDPAVAAVGPPIPINGQDHHYHHHHQQHLSPMWSSHSPPTYPQPNFLPHNLFHPRSNSFFNANDAHNSDKLMFGSFPAQIHNLDASFSGSLNNVTSSSNSSSNIGDNWGLGKFDNSKEVGGLGFRDGGFGGQARNHEVDRKVDSFSSGVHNQGGVHRSSPGPRNPPPGFPSKLRGGAGGNEDTRRMGSEHNRHNVSELRNMEVGLRNGVERMGRGLHEGGVSHVGGNFGLSGQLDHPGPPAGSNLQSASASNIEKSMLDLRHRIDKHEIEYGGVKVERVRREDDYSLNDIALDELSQQVMDSLGIEDGIDDNNNKSKKKKNRDKDVRSDTRGQHMLNQRMRNIKRRMDCPRDINRLDDPFLEIYESLIPAEEEKARQRKLLTLLERLVNKEWPQARLYIYGSCANSFGVSRSDIDVCLVIDGAEINKSDLLLKLANILEADNLQNVQALTRARVPIVKLMDPDTGLSCDICVNNVLAVVNTKLLRDYAKIDVRLRQLAFIVKHWAKSRGVNETYHGTLSSYAYVLMCIHFLQQRRPAILPCLQEMATTYSVTIDNTECAFFDRVDQLTDFGACNKEGISELVWGFFNYWAYGHDYANTVISVRTGRVLSKQAKDWTRRIGNDRHLICIEDPFETSHDLGRVVDKNSIRVLREEFERAAYIMQHDPEPCTTLFEPYVPTI